MKKLLICAALSTVLLSGCSFMNSRNEIIKVNDIVITQGQFDKTFDKEINNSMFKAFGGADNFLKSDDNIMYLLYKEKVSKELIIKALLDKEIEEKGIKVSDEDIKNEMKSIIDKVGSKEELARMLKQRNISNDDFNNDLKTQIRMKKLIDSIQKVSISDADTLKYYKQNPDKFKTDEQVRASHILVSFNTLDIIRGLKAKNKNLSATDMNTELEKIESVQKAKAEEILKKVNADPDSFAKIAKEESDDKASAERGGELGFFSKDAMVPEFSKAAFAMKPNTISDKLVQSSYGFHIIKVTDRMEAGVTPYAKIKDEIKFYLETEAQMKVLKNFTDGLLKNAKIEYVDKTYSPEDISAKISKMQKTTTEKKIRSSI